MSTFYIKYPVERRTSRCTDWHLSVVKVIHDRTRAAELEQPQILLSRCFHHILLVVIIANNCDGACWSQHADDTIINCFGITIGKFLLLNIDYISWHSRCSVARHFCHWFLCIIMAKIKLMISQALWGLWSWSLLHWLQNQILHGGAFVEFLNSIVKERRNWQFTFLKTPVVFGHDENCATDDENKAYWLFSWIKSRKHYFRNGTPKKSKLNRFLLK